MCQYKADLIDRNLNLSHAWLGDLDLNGALKNAFMHLAVYHLTDYT